MIRDIDPRGYDPVGLRTALPKKRRLPWRCLLSMPVSRFSVGLHLTGFSRASEFAPAIRRVNASVPPAVRAARLRSALSVDVRSDLAGVSVPLLLIRGSKDRLVFAGSAKRLLAAHPSARVVSLDGPHMLLQVAPARCWGAIMEFLSGHSVG